MTKKLRVYAEAPEPLVVEGSTVPWCSAKCAHYVVDERECALVGVAALDVCTPQVREMAAELIALKFCLEALP